MKDQNNIDKLFSSKLVEKEFEVTPEHLHLINQQLDALPSAKKKRGVLFFSSIAGLLLILCLGICLWNYSKSDVDNEKLRSSQTDFSKRNLNRTATENNERITLSSQVSTGEKNQSNNNILKKTSMNQNSPDQNLNAVNQTTKNQDFNYSNSTNTPFEVNYSNDTDVNPINQASKQNGANDADVNSVKQASIENDTNNTDVNPIDQASKENDINNGEVSEPEQNNSNPAISKNNLSTSYWSFQASAGGNFISKKIIGESTNYITKRTDEEGNIFTPQFDLGVNYNIGRVSVSTGLNYIQYGETIKYSEVISDTTYISSYTNVTDSAGNVTSIPNYTTISQTDSTLISANGNNRHTYLTIPLSVGYRFNLAQSNFSITPKAGIGLRFLVNGNGRYASADLNAVLEEKDKTLSLSYHGSIEFAYRLRKMSFFVAPNYNAAMGSFHSLHQYRAIGGMIGIIYHP